MSSPGARTQVGLGDDGALRVIPAPGMTLREMRENVGATWDPDYEGWKIPPLRTYLTQILEAIPDAQVTPGARRLLIDRPLGGRLTHPRALDLYPFQRRAVQYLVTSQHGGLLCLSPGLGKTVVSTVALNEVRAGRVLIAVPASLLRTWEREIRTWSTHQNVSLAHGTPPAERGWVVTTYDSLVRHLDWFDKETWDVLVLDESVLVKNRTTQRFKALKKLRKHAGAVWELSGSPTTRFADDLWTQMHLLYPTAFRSYWRFAERFCVFADNIWSKTGKEIVGSRQNVDPARELGDLMLVMNQEDVLPELPEYLFETIDVELTTRQKKAYRTMLTNFFMELSQDERLDADTKLAQLVRLQQIVSGMANFKTTNTDTDSVKSDTIVNLLADGTYQTPAIVWTQFKGNAAYLTAALRAREINAKWVSGDSSAKTRDAMIEEFKAGAYDVLVLSLGVGKFGHTMTDARTVFYLDKTWAADDYFQSLRRVRRIGLKHRPVIVTVRAPGTVDELLEMNLAGKMPSIAKITNSALKELLRGLGI